MKNLLILLLLPLYSCFNLQRIIGTTLITSSLLTSPVDSINKYHQQTPVPIVTDNGQFTTSKITTQRNNIYLYGDVTPESCEELKNYITEMDFNGKLFRITYNLDPPPINLHIQSSGGSLMNALYIVDLVDSLDTPVNTYIDGYSASAASLINVVGKKRYMTKNSMILIHQLSSNKQGKFEELNDEMSNLNQLMKKIKTIYSEHTHIPIGVLDELLKHDIWFDSTTSKNYGLIDEII